MFTTTLLASVAYQKELQRQVRKDDLQELYPTQNLYSVRRRRKLAFPKLTLSLADVMINTGQQLKERSQPA